MLSNIKKFAQLPRKEKRLFWEAYWTLGVMRAAILRIPFKNLTRSLQHSPKKGKSVMLNEEQKRTALAIGRAIERAALHTPWESACLAQSLAAQKMLKKRGIPGVFYLGVAKDNEVEEKMKAHAWTECGEMILTGGRGHEAFTVVSVFGWTEK